MAPPARVLGPHCRARARAGRRGVGRSAREQRRGSPPLRPARARAQALSSERGCRRSARRRKGHRLDPRRHAAAGAARGLPGPARLPLPAIASRGGAPGSCRAGRRRRRRRFRRQRDGRVGVAGRRGERAVRRARLARRDRRRVGRRRDGPHVVWPRLRRARGRGAGGRRCASRDSPGTGSAAGRPDPRRNRRAAAPERGGLRAAFSDAMDAVLGQRA